MSAYGSVYNKSASFQSVITADLEVDGGTISVDETNNRVGIGETGPGTQLQVSGTAPYVTLKNSTSENTDGGCESKIIGEDHANVTLGQIEISHSGSSDDTKGKLILSTHTGSALTAALTINEAQKSTFANNVGIGGVSSANLSIESSGTDDSVIRINHNNGAGDPFLKLTTNAVNWSVGLDNSDADKFMIASGATPSTNPRLTVDTAGNIGIGTVTPDCMLHVAGAAAFSGPSETFVTFSDGDATPSVATGNLFKHHASTETITMFDDGVAGQTITVISTAAITYDVTSTNLKGGSTDLVTANGDVTQWCFDGTNWYLLQFMDVSADMSSVGGGGGTAANDVDALLHHQVFS